MSFFDIKFGEVRDSEAFYLVRYLGDMCPFINWFQSDGGCES